MAAIHFGIKHFHHYLYGGCPFTVFTDHKPLETLNKNHTKTLSRLQEDLMEYNYTIKYRPGKDNGPADFLSRNPIISMSHSYYNLKSEEDVFWLLDEQANERLCAMSNNISPTLGIQSPIDDLSLESDDITYLQKKDAILRQIRETLNLPFIPMVLEPY